MRRRRLRRRLASSPAGLPAPPVALAGGWPAPHPPSVHVGDHASQTASEPNDWDSPELPERPIEHLRARRARAPGHGEMLHAHALLARTPVPLHLRLLQPRRPGVANLQRSPAPQVRCTRTFDGPSWTGWGVRPSEVAFLPFLTSTRSERRPRSDEFCQSLTFYSFCLAPPEAPCR